MFLGWFQPNDRSVIILRPIRTECRSSGRQRVEQLLKESDQATGVLVGVFNGRHHALSFKSIAGTLFRYARYSGPNLFAISLSSMRIIAAPVTIANAVSSPQTIRPVPTLQASISQRWAR